MFGSVAQTLITGSLSICAQPIDYVELLENEALSARIIVDQKLLAFTESRGNGALAFGPPPVPIDFCADLPNYLCFETSHQPSNLWNFSIPKRSISVGLTWNLRGKEFTVSDSYAHGETTKYIVRSVGSSFSHTYLFDDRDGLLMMYSEASSETEALQRLYLAKSIGFGSSRCEHK